MLIIRNFHKLGCHPNHPLVTASPYSRLFQIITLMNPVVWERLPRDLVVLVLARLPALEIIHLRCQLSKEWTMDNEFHRACDKVNPNMAAVVSFARQGNAFLVRIFDSKKPGWLYAYRFRLTNQGIAPCWFDTFGTQSVWMPMASDGGLVCFVSIWKYTEANPLCIVVMNLLTRVQHELPPLQRMYTVPPTMVHMIVDPKTKGYKVVVIVKMKGRYIVETYDSVSSQWSNATPSWGRILGRAHEWRNRDRVYFLVRSPKPCAYDLEEGQLELLDYRLLFSSEGAQVMNYALACDRMFVLYKRLSHIDEGYFIKEFQSQNNVEAWVLVRTLDQCSSRGEDVRNLLACEDILMLRKQFYGRIYNLNQICYFVNISNNEWHKLPGKLPQERFFCLVCRVSWQVIP